jgi:prevent-host-death family protein
VQRVWQLQEAKNKLSEVVDEAISNGPQLITRRGAGAAVVISVADYRKLTAREQKLSDFFRTSPLAGLELDLGRDAGPQRPDIAL